MPVATEGQSNDVVLILQWKADAVTRDAFEKAHPGMTVIELGEHDYARVFKRQIDVCHPDDRPIERMTDLAEAGIQNLVWWPFVFTLGKMA